MASFNLALIFLLDFDVIPPASDVQHVSKVMFVTALSNGGVMCLRKDVTHFLQGSFIYTPLFRVTIRVLFGYFDG